MSFSYEDFYLSGFNTGSTISGIQKNTPLYWVLTGLKYNSSPITTADFSWFTGIAVAGSGTLTEQSGFIGWDAEHDEYRGTLIFNSASGLTATGIARLYWNSGVTVQEEYALEGTFYTFSNKGEDAWNIITDANDSIDNADAMHGHAGGDTTTLQFTSGSVVLKFYMNNGIIYVESTGATGLVLKDINIHPNSAEKIYGAVYN